jgi:predicted secreted protein
MTNALAGVGTIFERWSGAVWQTIAEINSIEGPTMDKEAIDVTSLETGGGYDEFITGFMDGGTLVLNMNFTRSGYELMKSDFEIDVARDYRIAIPDEEDTTLEFEGLVIEIPLTMEAGDKLTADVTIQVTGEVAIDTGSAVAASSEDEVPIPSEDPSSGSAPGILNDGNTMIWFEYDDEDNFTLDSVDLVSQWNDLSGNSRHLKQTTESRMPKRQATGVLFDGAADYLVCDAFTWNRPAMFYIVYKNVTITVSDRIFDGNVENICAFAQSTGLNYLGSSALISQPVTADTWYIARAYQQASPFTGCTLQLNEDSIDDGEMGGSSGPGGFTLGKGGGEANQYRYGHIEVKAVIGRKIHDADSDQMDIVDYLNAKYNIY